MVRLRIDTHYAEPPMLRALVLFKENCGELQVKSGAGARRSSSRMQLQQFHQVCRQFSTRQFDLNAQQRRNTREACDFAG